MAEYIIKIGNEPDIMGNYPLKDKPIELFRCKDCKWWNSNLGEICDRGHGYPGADWFCADGERKTE